ncbi:MAG: hypothetical protein M3Y85_10695, partial [Bacteroidota bacterium]|nr:hypothetical protein [Bacteroidota bacterium]
MLTSMQSTDQTKMPLKKGWKESLLNLFRLTAQPVIKLYHGYGHENCITVFGHVFKLSPFPRKKYRQSLLRNTLALLRLFVIKPFAGVEVQIEWKGTTYKTITDNDGFFKFNWKDTASLEKGWIEVGAEAFYQSRLIATSAGKLFIPYETQYIIISDIDDTFLISHSSNLRKRLLV